MATEWTVKSDHTDEWKRKFSSAVTKALTAVGEACEGYAKAGCPVDTGRLRASITYEVDEAEQAVYVGTNVSYAPKVELGRTAGAGKGDSIESDPSYESKPGHVTVKLPYPYLTPAAQNHSDEYRALVKKYLS